MDMPKPNLKPTTELWRWMNYHRVTLDELAARICSSSVHISNIRRGKHPPSDELKIAIANATLEMERERGITKPFGVPIVCWFSGLDAAITGAAVRAVPW